jgi:squalene synthase HpnC
VTRDATRSEDASAPGAVVGQGGWAETSTARGGGAGASSASARVITAGAGAKAADENFPVALRLLPGRYRQHLTAVYGFARSADDMGDEAPPDERLTLLDELEADLGRLYQPGGEGPRLPVVQALAPAVAQCSIPAQPFLDLIQANRQDQAVSRYQTFDELLGYCRLSANPVGRIVLYVFGAATPSRERLSDLVCTALQLAEHWQDVAEDLRAGRVYLPAEDLAGHGVTAAGLAAPSASPQVRRLIEFEVRRAAGLLDEGAAIVGTLRGFARAAVAGYVAGGRAALAAITASDCDVLAATPRPRKHRVAAELLRAYITGR